MNQAGDTATTELYATKEVKLIGMPVEIFKKLQKTTTVNRLRRILGIQVSLVVIEGADDSFVDVLSCDSTDPASPKGGPTSQSKLSTGMDTTQAQLSPTARLRAALDAEEIEDTTQQVDFPERYTDLKHRTKLVLSAYTNMVGTMSPELISHNSTIVREVVRLSATLHGARNIKSTLALSLIHI